MRGCFLLGVFLAVSFGVNAQPEIEWNADYKLKYSDFQGTPVDSIEGQIHPDISISYNLHTKHIFRKVYNDNVATYFLRTTSFARTNDSTYLQFARSIFDLSEVMARELRRDFSKQGRGVYSHKAHEAYLLLEKKFNEIRTQYTAESDFGKNKEKQEEWEKWIALQLFELTPYAKDYVPQRVLENNGPARYH